jgi:hypothetical protein
MNNMFEIVFLGCFAFGALFTLLSAGLGAITGHGGGHLHGAHGPAGHAGHAGHMEPAHYGVLGHHADVSQASSWGNVLQHLNLYSVNGFLTWFGAFGFGLTHMLGWPVAIATTVAAVAGAIGGLTVAIYLARLRSGERIMDPADYRIEGTLARVSISMGVNGIGEIVFEKQGVRHSEAARSLDGSALPKGTEVLIVSYANGVAEVRPFSDVVAERFPGSDIDEPREGMIGS